MAVVWDVFDGAVRVLVGAGTVKQRLIDAWRGHLSTLTDQELPDALRPRLAQLRAALHAAQAAGGLTSPEVSVRKMSEKDAADHAVRVIEMYAQLAGLEGDATGQPRLRIVNTPPNPSTRVADYDDLPAFLSRA